jgi:hypothetical protein
MTMSGHQLLDGKADPVMVGVIGRAFDRAWSEIESHFDETDAEFARVRLAQTILIVASDQEPRDILELKTEALQVLALTYRVLTAEGVGGILRSEQPAK